MWQLVGMKAKSIGGGVYEDADGGFWIRPVVDGSRTWRKLDAATKRQAISQAGELLYRHKMAEETGKMSPLDPASRLTVRDAITAYLNGAMPRADVIRYLLRIDEWFNVMPARNVSRLHCHQYAEWRMGQCTNGEGTRLVDLELAALSTVLSFAVERGMLEENAIRGRASFHRSNKVRKCRETMPANGDVLNDYADAFFHLEHFQPIGWQMLFEAMTGMRTCEALRLKWNAKRGEPGFVEGDRLDIQRAKKGVNPWVLITPDLRELMEAHAQWHRGRFEPWFPCGKAQLAVQLTRMNGFPKVTSHGMRAYFVTKMRRDGHDDRDIAAMIGDKTVSLIQSTYGQPRPGEPTLSFRRSDGTAAWDRWLPLREATNVIPFGAACPEPLHEQPSPPSSQASRTPTP